MMENEVRFEIIDINGCETMKGRVDIETIDDDEPNMVTSSDMVVDWDIISQYLWDYRDRKVIKMVEGLLLKINMEA